MDLPETEQRIMDVLKLHSPNWLINPDIALQIGHMHNYCAKLLSFLINKGLIESRYVVKDGEKMSYKEYRLISQKPQEAKALSIRQPWAWLIINGIKDIENRDWYCKYRGLLYIHTGKKFDRDGWDYISDVMNVTIPESPSSYEMGGIIGRVDMVDCVTKSDSKWFFGKYGFVFSNPQKLTFVPCKGQLSIFNVERDLSPSKVETTLPMPQGEKRDSSPNNAPNRYQNIVAPEVCRDCAIYFQLATEGKKCEIGCR